MAQLEMAAGAVGYEGNKPQDEARPRGLYRQHCAQCHGITGDGYGPAAAMLSPYPRDFRRGIYKFKSTTRDAMPTDNDLRRVIVEGLPDTAMPSFQLLDNDQIDALVEYTRYLSIRGQVERELVAMPASEWNQKTVEALVQEVAKRWEMADDRVVVPDPDSLPREDRTPAEIKKSAQLGEAIFLSAAAKCMECHGKTGQPDRLTELDDWSRENFDFRTETAARAESLTAERTRVEGMAGAHRERAEARLQELAPPLRARQQVVATLLEPEYAKPRDFSSGIFRGGSESIDLFRRIHQGIPGTPMPAHGSPRPGVAGVLTDQEIFQVVDYLKNDSKNRE